MDNSISNVVLLVFLVLAGVMYWLNYTTGMVVFLVLAVCFELIFWLGFLEDSEEQRFIKGSPKE